MTRVAAHRFPRLRWLAAIWLLVYIPAYAGTYGYWHFLQLCNVGICLTTLAIVLDRPLLLSSQAVAAPSIALLWVADAALRVVTGEHLHGATAYMWDASIPPLVRALSLYHLAWPLLLAWCLRRTGYDPRGLALQALIACGVFTIGVWLAPAAENLNYLQRWPLDPPEAAYPALRVPIMLLVLIALVYWPTHRLLVHLSRSRVSSRWVLGL